MLLKAGATSKPFIINRYTSLAGGAIKKASEIRYWVKRPASGALKGALLLKNEEKGNIPSRPNSCTTV
jgi:hypothetical protein